MKKYLPIQYKQRNFGDCLLACLANLFDDDDFFDFPYEEGVCYYEANKLMESLGYNCFIAVDLRVNGIQRELMSFYHTQSFLSENYFAPYLFTVPSSVKNHLHSILFLAKDEVGYLIDPSKDFIYKATIYEVFDYYGRVFEVAPFWKISPKSESAVAMKVPYLKQKIANVHS